ncbi:MAG: succinate dehydrogenase cytochrome b subunit [Proteobacteria bacterium]|nr:succinate dehydrogenase cytochrome b subunit [Pseudomonadota bacterium]
MIASAAGPHVARTSIGQKVLMAASGALLFLFVIGHLLGNLQIFRGPQAIDAYAHFLQSNAALLWGARITLFCALLVHGWAAVATTLRSWRARREPYAGQRRYRTATLFSRSMRVTGPLIFAYVVYHLLHLTVGSAHPDFVEGQVYRNVVVGFSEPLAAVTYMLAMTALGLHLVHGVWSMFQTLGLSNGRWRRRLRLLAGSVTALIVAGNVSIPLAVLAGWLRL